MNNQVTLCGHVGKEPQATKFEDTGNQVVKFSLAVKEFSPNTDEVKTLWFDVDCWNGLAARVLETVTKGRELVISGRLVTQLVYQRSEWCEGAGHQTCGQAHVVLPLWPKPKAEDEKGTGDNRTQVAQEKTCRSKALEQKWAEIEGLCPLFFLSPDLQLELLLFSRRCKCCIVPCACPGDELRRLDMRRAALSLSCPAQKPKPEPPAFNAQAFGRIREALRAGPTVRALRAVLHAVRSQP